MHKLMGNESELLYGALCYERRYKRRTEHILKVYALAKLLGERENVSPEEREILQAAAILHDIAIGYCKERYNGDACQANQKKEAPGLVEKFLREAQYEASSFPRILDLVLRHHGYDEPREKLLQLLIEADLLVNCYETAPGSGELQKIESLFQTETGKNLFSLYLAGRKE